MFNRKSLSVLLTIGICVISGSQLAATAAYAEQVKVLKNTLRVGNDVTKLKNGARSNQSQSIDCSIQSHPDCQPQTEHFFTVEIGEGKT